MRDEQIGRRKDEKIRKKVAGSFYTAGTSRNLLLCGITSNQHSFCWLLGLYHCVISFIVS